VSGETEGRRTVILNRQPASTQDAGRRQQANKEARAGMEAGKSWSHTLAVATARGHYH
jgi:hypothetical protein